MPLKQVLGCAWRAAAINIKFIQERSPRILDAGMHVLHGLTLAACCFSLDFNEPGLMVEALKTAESFVRLVALLPEALDSRDPEVSQRPALLLRSLIDGFTAMIDSAMAWSCGAGFHTGLEPDAVVAVADLLEFA